MSPPLCCRRTRTSATFRSKLAYSASPAATATPPPLELTPAALNAAPPRQQVRLQMLMGLLGCDGAVSPGDLACLADAHGWSLPPLARREGGLYALPAQGIVKLRHEAALAGRSHLLALAYEDSSLLAPLYAAPPQASSDVGALPTFDMAATGSAVPPAAVEMLGSQMACVFRRTRIFPAACDKWCRPEYLSAQLRLSCHVLVAPAARKRFKYHVDLRTAPDRVPADYAFTPLVRSVKTGMHAYTRMRAYHTWSCTL